jgi:hypothetical protein
MVENQNQQKPFLNNIQNNIMELTPYLLRCPFLHGEGNLTVQCA